MQPTVDAAQKIVADDFFFTGLSIIGNVGIACVLIVILNMLLYRFKGTPAPGTKAPNLILGLLVLFLVWYFTYISWGVKTIPERGYPQDIGLLGSLLSLLPLVYVLVLSLSFLAYVCGCRNYLSSWERALFVIGLVVFLITLPLWPLQVDMILQNVSNSEVDTFVNFMGSIFVRALLPLSLSLVAYMTWMLHVRMKLQPRIDEPPTGASESGPK